MKLPAIFLASLMITGSMQAMEEKNETMKDYAREFGKHAAIIKSATHSKDTKKNISILIGTVSTLICCCPCIAISALRESCCPTRK